MEYTVSTSRSDELIDITNLVQKTVNKSGIIDGMVTVFVPHTTAGVTINENADPDVQHDLLIGLDRAFPRNKGYHHEEGNSHAHLKASVMGASCTVIVEAAAFYTLC